MKTSILIAVRYYRHVMYQGQGCHFIIELFLKIVFQERKMSALITTFDCYILLVLAFAIIFVSTSIFVERLFSSKEFPFTCYSSNYITFCFLFKNERFFLKQRSSIKNVL